jgi:hypothetical protein
MEAFKFAILRNSELANPPTNTKIRKVTCDMYWRLVELANRLGHRWGGATPDPCSGESHDAEIVGAGTKSIHSVCCHIRVSNRDSNV